MATLYISSIGQKSADYGNDFEFSTTKDDGNKKFIKYTAVSLGYSQWNTDVDELTKFTTQKIRLSILSGKAIILFQKS
jgi:hypothetical protein